MSSNKADLNAQNLWKISITLQEEGGGKSHIASGKLRFVQSRNYEPPQGKVYVETDYNGFFKTDENGFCGKWTLSEDKKERKDGLWICK